MGYSYNLHTHSCLSPCADDDMTVNNIASMSALCGIEIVALTDHNSLKNCPAFFTACGKTGVTPIAGTELTTREEAHVICLFPSLESAMEFDELIETLLPCFMNNIKIFGRQQILDGNDNIVGEEQKLLISACDIGVGDLPDMLRPYGGMAIPAHIDRRANGLIANLGFIPPERYFNCYEVYDLQSMSKLIIKNPILATSHIINNTDAHSLADIPREICTLGLSERSAPALIDYLSS